MLRHLSEASLWPGREKTAGRQATHGERGPVRPVGLDVIGGRRRLPAKGIHAACHVCVVMLEQPDQVARGEEDIVQEDQAVSWPWGRCTQVWHLHPLKETLFSIGATIDWLAAHARSDIGALPVGLSYACTYMCSYRLPPFTSQA